MLERLLVGVTLAALAFAAGQAARGEAGAPAAILFERGGDLYAVAVDGSQTVRVTRTRVGEREPAVSRDGRWVAFTNAAGGPGLWTMRVDGMQRTRIASSPIWIASPDWSRDGSTIFFSRYFVGNQFGATCGAIFSVGRDGRGLRPISRPDGHSHEDPDVSPNGRRVAFTDANACEGGTTDYAVRVVDTSGRPTGDLARLRGNAYDAPPEYTDPAWSPDGRRLALDSRGIVVVNRDGIGVRRITPSRMTGGDPVWSPDGKWIAFVGGYENGPSDVHVIRPDGAGLRRLTRGEAYEASPGWLPRLPRR